MDGHAGPVDHRHPSLIMRHHCWWRAQTGSALGRGQSAHWSGPTTWRRMHTRSCRDDPCIILEPLLQQSSSVHGSIADLVCAAKQAQPSATIDDVNLNEPNAKTLSTVFGRKCDRAKRVVSPAALRGSQGHAWELGEAFDTLMESDVHGGSRSVEPSRERIHLECQKRWSIGDQSNSRGQNRTAFPCRRSLRRPSPWCSSPSRTRRLADKLRYCPSSPGICNSPYLCCGLV